MDKATIVRIGCPLNVATHVLTGKYKIEILFNLLAGDMRFGELRKELSHVSTKVLSQQLKDLEKDGILTRTVYAEVPPRTVYSLTDLGRSLRPVVTEMYKWGETFFSEYDLEIPCRDDVVTRALDL